MVIDSSALVSILLREPEADSFTKSIAAAPRRLIGTPSLLETGMVMVGRLGPPGHGLVDRLLRDAGIEVVAFTVAQAERAMGAFLSYGKGRHPAGLNFGDCCSYALAAETALPLLFKGRRLRPNRHPFSTGVPRLTAPRPSPTTRPGSIGSTR